MASVRGTAFLQYGELLGQHGVSLRAHLAPFKVDMDVVGNFDRQLPYQSLAQIFEGSARALGLPHLGLELGERQGLALIGPLQHLARTAPTVGEALVAVLRYMRLYSPSIHYRLERRPGQALLYFDNALPSSQELPQIVEKSVLQGRLLISEVLGRPFQPRTVLLRHGQLGDLSTYERYYGCPVLFHQEHNILVLPPEILQRPSAQHDATLHAILRFYLEAQGDIEGDLRAEVEQRIQALLPNHRCNLEHVAGSLGLHPRTLQRRLAVDGIDFEDHVDRIRRNQAEKMLRYSGLGVGQIARQLGYLRTTSFCRAHQRWFGMTPLEHRRKLCPELPIVSGDDD
ncbi:AraC family transcriptional regulator [Pseudomonas citronellolis]|uniref:AraC family transcriptional regulator n=1 Tax=Pseudomonas citronellolis TaxID=53408 RepID=UPI0023E361B2|nr:AraC family transcriptional regulator [Pseudomonas citronellolis]MDF3935564.1 AraC family transcriptional regulator [Pseudomonas citronellolis]